MQCLGFSRGFFVALKTVVWADARILEWILEMLTLCAEKPAENQLFL